MTLSQCVPRSASPALPATNAVMEFKAEHPPAPCEVMFDIGADY